MIKSTDGSSKNLYFRGIPRLALFERGSSKRSLSSSLPLRNLSHKILTVRIGERTSLLKTPYRIGFRLLWLINARII